MTYFPELTLAAGAQLDAFGRLRTSGTGQRLDIEFIYDKQEAYFDEVTNNGSVTHNASTRDLTLALSSAAAGSYSSMASHPVPYTPGNSQLIDITAVLNLANISGGNAEVFLRSSVSGSPVDLTVIPQSSWLNATSGVDWTKSHIFQMDFQSLKVGTIRFSMVRDGLPVAIARINNDNLYNSGYWQLPSLPAFWKIYTDATYTYMEAGYGDDNNAIGFRYKVPVTASATMKAICCTVKSEGGENLSNMSGLPRSIDMGVTPKTVGATLIPLISIRSKDTYQSLDNLMLALIRTFSVSTDNPIKLAIKHDVVLTGASWADVDTTISTIEYDVTATALSNGHDVFSDYVTTASKNQGTARQGVLGKTVLWNRKGAETGIVTIGAVRTTATSASCLASMQWEEIR